MGLGPMPYDVRTVVYSDEETTNGHYVYSEICDLHGGDDLYGVIVVAASNSIIDKVKRLLSPDSKPPVPEDSIVVEESRIVEDGELEAVEVKKDLFEEVVNEL